MEWGAAIASIFGVILLLLKQWQAKKPERDKEKTHDETQDGRQALYDGDVPAIEHRIDIVLQEGGGHSPSGVESAEDIERRISRL